jgi:hypothetical protein
MVVEVQHTRLGRSKPSACRSSSPLPQAASGEARRCWGNIRGKFCGNMGIVRLRLRGWWRVRRYLLCKEAISPLLSRVALAQRLSIADVFF